jgi:hypothetical protein
VRVRFVRPLLTLLGVKQRGDEMPSAIDLSAQVQLAETDESAPRGGELEGCALHCGNGSEATLDAAKPTAGSRSHVLDPKTVAQALSLDHNGKRRFLQKLDLAWSWASGRTVGYPWGK